MNEVNEKIEQTLKSCQSACFCNKGEFYPDKDFGSKIRQSLDNEKLLLSFARSALKDIDGVYVKNAKFDGDFVFLEILVNDEQRQVCIKL